MSPIEAVADAMMAMEGWHIGSRSYRNRNPGNLRDSPLKDKMDADDYCVFKSLAGGYGALVWDLRQKFTGNSDHHLTPNSSLLELVNVYAPAGDHNNPSAYTLFVAGWLTKVFGATFTSKTTLGEVLSFGLVVKPL